MGLWGLGGISALGTQANLLEVPAYTFGVITSQGVFRARSRCPPGQAQLCPGHRQLRTGRVSAPGAARDSDPRCGRAVPGQSPPGWCPMVPARLGWCPMVPAGLGWQPAPAFPQRRWKSGPATGGREGETAAAAPPSGERLGEAGVKSRISMRAGLMQITATRSSRRKAKQLQPGLPSSALQPGEA